MQRIAAFLLTLFLATLTGGCATLNGLVPVRDARANPAPSKPASVAIATAAPAPTPPTVGPSVRTAPLLASAAPTLAEKAAPGKPDAISPHIGLLLPLSTQTFRQPAEAVKLGVLAAAQSQPEMPAVHIYPTTDQVPNILAVYQQAIENGARVIIGPLTKNAVAALAESDISAVPTLALSVPANETVSANLYLFGLALDAETRQVARLAASEGHDSVLIVSAGNALGRHLQSAFSEEWQHLGGKIAGQLSFTSNTDLNTLHEKLEKLQPDSIFLAVNASEARLVRPYLSAVIPTYATSLTFGGQADAQKNVDLTGVRFLDMPWMLQPDHPAVMVYPRPEKPLSNDSERLYAMGIDAYRLAQLFYRGEMPTHGVVLDGVTGQINLSGGRHFTRELTAAEFQSGVVVVLDHAKP